MYLAYIDESGSKLMKHKGDFVVSCIIIHDSHIDIIDQEINKIKSKYFPNHNINEIEIHIAEIIHKRGAFLNLDNNKNYDLLNEVYEFISKLDCYLISIIIKKKFIYKPLDIELWAFRLLFERIDKIMVKLKDEKGINEYCLMVLDSINLSFDVRRRKYLLDFIRKGTRYIENHLVFDDVLFVNSELRGICQLADSIAFCVRRINDERCKPSITSEKFKNYYNLIFPKFDKSKTGEVLGYGIKYFPKEK